MNEFSSELSLVKRDGSYGYINKNGKKVIYCQYDNAADFIEGYARVRRGANYFYVRKNGEECKDRPVY